MLLLAIRRAHVRGAGSIPAPAQAPWPRPAQHTAQHMWPPDAHDACAHTCIVCVVKTPNDVTPIGRTQTDRRLLRMCACPSRSAEEAWRLSHGRKHPVVSQGVHVKGLVGQPHGLP